MFFPSASPQGESVPKAGLGGAERRGEKGRKRKSKTRAGCDSRQGERRAGGGSKGEENPKGSRVARRVWRESGGAPSPDSPSPALWGAASSEPFID